MNDDGSLPQANAVSLATIAREWTRLGCIGFGGPPTHIILLRRLCVEERHWIEPEEFEDAIAATNLLPGPASTQLAIFCAWKLRGVRGAVIGGLGFICPGLLLIIALSAVFLAPASADRDSRGRRWGRSMAVLDGSHAARGLLPASWKRIGSTGIQQDRWVGYAIVGGVCAALFGEYLVIALIACGVVEIVIRRRDTLGATRFFALTAGRSSSHHGDRGVCRRSVAGGDQSWRPLSYGGGFRDHSPDALHDAVTTLSTLDDGTTVPERRGPRPSHARSGRPDGVGRGIRRGRGGRCIPGRGTRVRPVVRLRHRGRFEVQRNSLQRRGAVLFHRRGTAAVIRAIAGSAIPLGLSLHQYWQIPVLAGALVWLLLARRSVVGCLLAAGVIGAILGLVGVHV